MPQFDGTGPMGQGPRTGREKGPCVVTTPIQKETTTTNVESKISTLENEVAQIKQQLSNIQENSK